MDVGSGDEDVDVVIAVEVTGFGRQHAQKGNAVSKKGDNIKRVFEQTKDKLK